MSLISIVASVFVAAIALCATYIYLFGIPPEAKRKLEEKALETVGENKASYVVKDAIKTVPTSNQKEVKDLKEGLSNAVGGLLQNTLGKAIGDMADDATEDLTGR